MSAARTLPPIATLNGLRADEFSAVVGPLFENAPTFLALLAARRPLASDEALWPAALEIARAMPEAAQVELIDAHPRLGAPPASVSAMSFREQGYGSSEAQGARTVDADDAAPVAVAAQVAEADDVAQAADAAQVAEADDVAQAADAAQVAEADDVAQAADAAESAGRVAAELERLNQAYEARFGFRYCVFVNGRSRAELIPGMVAALEADRAAEIERAIGDIVAIAQARAGTLRARS
jgi:2-oxo-4-hydroxy-4-carboxy--5-ureidoimidazoline (OHCU) decarboxylase